MPTEPPEYLPRPVGYEERVAALVAAGTPAADAHWMAACEAIGAVGRSENNHVFWHDGKTADQHETWDRIAGREARRYYFHQAADTLVGYLAHGRHEAQINLRMAHRRMGRLVSFIKEHGLWDAWVAHNRTRPAHRAAPEATEAGRPDPERLSAANDRAWDVVKLLRLRSLRRGEHQYADPIGQMLSAALVGDESHDAVRREIEALETAAPAAASDRSGQ
jgi:hypothetical protein